ncbi:MAG: sigma-70 family RNA polymerase sigma factor, partial [Flavobacteriales bacterium]|nr:sigma-70 family RNA polymerase sigma factor [Flavobacteriales bacterium]
MKQSAQGDSKAFTELYDRYVQQMVNYFSKMLWNDKEKAMDLTHDLFTKLIKKPDLYSEGKKFSTWIYAIASNMCKNEYRSHEVRTRHAAGVKEFYGNSSYQSTRDEIDRSNFKDSLARELSNLDHDKRCTFIMRYKQRLSIRQISEVML